VCGQSTTDVVSTACAQPAANNTTFGCEHIANPVLTHLELHSTSKKCTALHGANELHIAGLAAVVGKRKIVRRILRKAYVESRQI